MFNSTRVATYTVGMGSLETYSLYQQRFNTYSQWHYTFLRQQVNPPEAQQQKFKYDLQKEVFKAKASSNQDFNRKKLSGMVEPTYGLFESILKHKFPGERIA